MDMAEFLRERGYRVHEAANAEEAREALQSKFAIDLVFTDINLVCEDKSGFRDAQAGRRSTLGFARSRCALAAVCRFRQRLFHAIQQVAPRIGLG